MNVGQVEIKTHCIENIFRKCSSEKKCNGSLIRKQCTPMPQTFVKKGFVLCIALLLLLLASMTIE